MTIYRRVHFVLTMTAICLLLLIINFTFRRTKSPKSDDYVDLLQPPHLTDSLHEAIRFNELIAYTQYICRTKIKVPEETFAFQVCLDPVLGININNGNFVFVTVSNSFEDFEFEMELLRLSNGSGVVLSPKTREEHEHLSHGRIKFYSGILVPTNSEDRGDGSRKFLIASDFRNNLSHLEKIDIFKLDCTNCWRLSDNPKLLLELIRQKLLTKVKQLHLVVRLEDNSRDLTYSWYSLLHSLYYESNFALYFAAQLGECGRTVLNCQYKLSFVKIPEKGKASILAPIAGMGFPEEEVSRLFSFINDQSKSCDGANQLQIGNTYWVSCLSFPSQGECKIYYFTFNSYDKIISKQCQMFLFDPTLTSEQTKVKLSDNLHIMSETLADKKFGNSTPGVLGSRSDWILTSLFDVMKNLNHNNIDLLILDLNGGEWDTFEEILSRDLIQNFHQIIVKLRIWFGEENENYRQIYSWLVRMKAAGWKMTSSFCLPSKHHYLMNSYDDKFNHNSCCVINFLRSF